jgi:hypothetical protein
MAKLRAIARCSLPIECAAHGDDAAPSRRLRTISIMIGVVPTGGRTRSCHVLSAGTWFTAPSASITVASCGVYERSDRTGPAGGRAVWYRCHAAAKQPPPATPGFSISSARPLLLVGDGSTARALLAVPSDTYSARAISSAATLGPGAPMKQGTPVHFVAALFRRSRQMRTECGERPKAAAHSHAPCR